MLYFLFCEFLAEKHTDQPCPRTYFVIAHIFNVIYCFNLCFQQVDLFQQIILENQHTEFLSILQEHQGSGLLRSHASDVQILPLDHRDGEGYSMAVLKALCICPKAHLLITAAFVVSPGTKNLFRGYTAMCCHRKTALILLPAKRLEENGFLYVMKNFDLQKVSSFILQYY